MPATSTATDARVILIGGGGHARVMADAIAASSRRLTGILDDADEPLVCLSHDAPRLGSLAEIEGVLVSHTRDRLSLAIGELCVRRRVLDGAPDGVRWCPPIVHPGAIVSPGASLGEGVFVGPGAVVNTGARIGAHAIINSGAIVEHDTEIGDNAHIAPGAALGGGVQVGPDALVGLGARVLPGVAVGPGAVAGAGAVVLSRVGAGERVVGNPARRH